MAAFIHLKCWRRNMPKLPPGVFKRPSKNGKTRYGVRVYDPCSKTKQRWVGTYDSVQEAVAAKSVAVAEQNLSGSMTVAEWSIRWLTECPRCEGTTRAYRYARNAVVRRFGHRQIRTITKGEGNSFMVSSTKAAGDAARVMFGDARRLGLIAINPFEGHRRSFPQMRRPTLPIGDEIDALTRAAVKVHGPVYGKLFGSMIDVAAWTAMRPGELFALCMNQVDLDHNTICVDRQLLRSGNPGEPKTRRFSDISLAPRARRALLAVAPDDPDAIVFRTLKGTPFSQSKLHYYWNPVRIAAGLPELWFYDLRHFCATQLVENRVLPHHVAIQLGHCDNGQLVMKHYLNPSDELARQEISAAFERLDARGSDDPDDGQAGMRCAVPRRPAPWTSGALARV
jgi:integrase